MIIYYILFLGIGITLTLTGCGEEKVRTVSYYTENPDEIEKVQYRCNAENDKGYKVEGNLAENCKNARRAKMKLIRSALR
ncbi:EexN family lipoprotein [Psychrobacter lutiphocae]|uniref:EexN family lipoprotein n=1 Tax=Psychrobacter lutiphocae TaxID=540500 RepID=UPI0038799890